MPSGEIIELLGEGTSLMAALSSRVNGLAPSPFAANGKEVVPRINVSQWEYSSKSGDGTVDARVLTGSEKEDIGTKEGDIESPLGQNGAGADADLWMSENGSRNESSANFESASSFPGRGAMVSIDEALPG